MSWLSSSWSVKAREMVCSGVSCTGAVSVFVVDASPWLILEESNLEIPLISAPCAFLTGESVLRSIGG